MINAVRGLLVRGHLHQMRLEMDAEMWPWPRSALPARAQG